MTVATTPCYDAIGVNVSSLPKGQHAGYATGTGIVPWTAAQWAADPHAVRIDQTPANTAANEECDILDIETGAATVGNCVTWAKAALVNFRNAKRPGQRSPAVYVNLSNLTPVVNALDAGGITSGIGLWVANWNLSSAAAAALVANAGGPFPIIAVQYRDAGAYDISMFSVPWLAAVAGKPKTPPPPPPGWTYPAPAVLTGVVSRAVDLFWTAAVPPAGEPAPDSYTVALYKGTTLSRTVVVTGLSVTLPGLSDGPHQVQVWANGSPVGSAHATVRFTV